MVQGDDNITDEACQYFEHIFTANTESISEDLLYCIPNIVTLEKNSILESVPSMEVQREVVSAINPNYAPG